MSSIQFDGTPVLRGEETTACCPSQSYPVETSRPHKYTAQNDMHAVLYPLGPGGHHAYIKEHGKYTSERGGVYILLPYCTQVRLIAICDK